MGSRTDTIIYRADEWLDPIKEETPKCIYQHYGYDSGTNVLCLLAFYDNGKYFKSLRDEDRFFIADYLFGYDYGGANDEYTPERYTSNLEGTADVFLVEIDGLKKACVAVEGLDERYKTDAQFYEYRKLIAGISSDEKGNKSFAYESGGLIRLYSLNDFLETFISKDYRGTRKIKELVKDFVRENSIEMMNSKEFRFIGEKEISFIGYTINKQKNLKATANLAYELSKEAPLRYVKNVSYSENTDRTINPDFHAKYHKDLKFYEKFYKETGWADEKKLAAMSKDFKALNKEISQINPNDSSAMDELRKEYQESQKQEESKQEHKHQNVRRNR